MGFEIQKFPRELGTEIIHNEMADAYLEGITVEIYIVFTKGIFIKSLISANFCLSKE